MHSLTFGRAFQALLQCLGSPRASPAHITLSSACLAQMRREEVNLRDTGMIDVRASSVLNACTEHAQISEVAGNPRDPRDNSALEVRTAPFG